MKLTKKHYSTFIRFLCVLTIFLLGLAAITGSGDDSSSTDYETIKASLKFDTFALSRASRSVQLLLRQYGLFERITESGLHATNRQAIASFSN